MYISGEIADGIWESFTGAALSNSLFHSMVIPYYLVIPCLLTTCLKVLSGIFLEELLTAFAKEWENIIGASLTAIPCFIPNSLFHSLVIPYYLVIPCLLTTSLKMLSGIFLEELQTAFAEEWENITGASLTARVSRAVWIELCDRSTIIPNRFISSTTVWNRKKNKKCITYSVHCATKFWFKFQFRYQLHIHVCMHIKKK